MRFLRVNTFRIRPGHGVEFVEAEKSVSAACEKIHADTAWVVYQVQEGMRGPAFMVLTENYQLHRSATRP
jgi:hypothetical protein